MARVETSGIDEVIEDLKKLGELTGDGADRILLAGAEEVSKARKKAAEMHGHRVTGAMINNIGYPKTPKTVNGVRQIEVYSKGKDKKGVRNAEKEFVLHYGTSSKPGTHWIDDAEKKAEAPAKAAMEAEYDELLKEKGLI